MSRLSIVSRRTVRFKAAPFSAELCTIYIPVYGYKLLYCISVGLPVVRTQCDACTKLYNLGVS